MRLYTAPMVALSRATGLVMLSGWALVLFGATVLRSAPPNRDRQRAAGALVVVAGIVVAVVARVAV